MIKKILICCAFFLSFTGICQKSEKYKTISPTEFNLALLKDSRAQLLDVRTTNEFATGGIKSAKNVNWMNADFEEKTSGLDKSKPVYVYCKSGGRSAKACSKLTEMGFTKVYNLDGGIDNWTKEKREIIIKK